MPGFYQLVSYLFSSDSTIFRTPIFTSKIAKKNCLLLKVGLLLAELYYK